jgi:ubiquinone/menaquinone biosynthesis C-methylase UbiE
MGIRERALKRENEKMSNEAFGVMIWLMTVVDFFYPEVGRRSRGFGIENGMTVVDYGCGPGRYTVKFAGIVGDKGKVIAADIHEMAIEAVKKKTKKKGIKNVEAVLIDGYDSGLPDNVADMVCALDMFFSVRKPKEFLKELNRITKIDGVLVIDEGHQKREEAKRKILESGYWDIVTESKDHMRCRPRVIESDMVTA